MTKSSQYIENKRRDYSLYTLTSRAIPSIADGLKAAARRVLWTAKDGKKYKSASLAGATMPIHPHASPEGTINTLAAPYGNNIPLLTGDGAFGTILNPTAYGASRYTSVKASPFTKDVVYADIELVPVQENYDGTLKEPVHFLPLVPIVLLNPQEGIAVGFASTLLPYSLEHIIEDQINYLRKKKISERNIYFAPLNQEGFKDNKDRWVFVGTYKKINTTTINITSLPYGTTHEKYINHLISLIESDQIVDYDDKSRDSYNIIIKFKRGVLAKLTETKLLSLLKLKASVSQNMNVIDFDGKRVLATNYIQVIENFSDWRLLWYKKRYQRLAKLLAIDIQKYKDILLAIKNNLGGIAGKIKSRKELKEFCTEIGIVNIDYIADLSVYRFTEEERKKVEKKLEEAEELMRWYQTLLTSRDERVKIYIKELQKVLREFKKGTYTGEKREIL